MRARDAARSTIELMMTAALRSKIEVWAPCPRIKCGAGKHGATEARGNERHGAGERGGRGDRTLTLTLSQRERGAEGRGERVPE